MKGLSPDLQFKTPKGGIGGEACIHSSDHFIGFRDS